jgi:Flp pilus assembly protein TadD
MMETINLFDQLLDQARRYQQTGQCRAAIDVLSRLTHYSTLPADLTGEVHALLGELLLKRRRLAQARKHLRLALRHQGSNARLYFLLGLAREQSPARAVQAFERSLALRPHQVRCRAELGLKLIDLGRTDEGIDHLQQAVRQAPTEAVIVGRLVKGLCRTGRFDEAVAAVRDALFLAPRCPKMRKLRADLQLVRLQRRQTMDDLRSCSNGPVLLPFLRPVSDDDTMEGERRDDASSLPGPHLVRLRVRASRRRAP